MKTIRLNDLQLVLLSATSNCEDGSLLPAPDSVADDLKRVQVAIYFARPPQAGGEDVTITDARRAAIGVSELRPTPIDDPVRLKVAASKDVESAGDSEHATAEADAATDSSA